MKEKRSFCHFKNARLLSKSHWDLNLQIILKIQSNCLLVIWAMIIGLFIRILKSIQNTLKSTINYSQRKSIIIIEGANLQISLSDQQNYWEM